eukprot:g34934.t1
MLRQSLCRTPWFRVSAAGNVQAGHSGQRLNCISDADGRSRGADSELDSTSRFQLETVEVTKPHNVFSAPADRAQRRFTWSRPDRSICSRIHFLLVSHMFSVRSTDVKLVFLSDHCLLLVNSHIQDDQQAGKGTWKPNIKLLTPGNIEELKRGYAGWGTVKSLTLQQNGGKHQEVFR